MNPLKIGVVGLGNMGWAVAAAMLQRGLHVLGIDLDEQKVSAMLKGTPPINEAGSREILDKAIKEERITGAHRACLASDCDIVYFAVQTPAKGNKCDYTALIAAIKNFLERAVTEREPLPVMLIGSTIYPGDIGQIIDAACLHHVDAHKRIAYHPVFLRAGYGTEDYLNPGKVICGTWDGESIPELVRYFDEMRLFPVKWVDFKTSEWIKAVHNAFLCVKVSFANEIADMCRLVNGADPHAVMEACFAERAAGRLLTMSHLRPGPPFSGPCLPKDIAIMNGLAHDERLGESSVMFAAENVNGDHIANLVCEWMNHKPKDKPLGIVGMAFRPGFDEMRHSLALHFVRVAKAAGREFSICDPFYEALIDKNDDSFYPGYLKACRGDEELEGLHKHFDHFIGICDDSGCLFINRKLDEGEKHIIRSSPSKPHIIDVYDNGLG